ncbi:uncharacterized protein LOC111702386 [Eurytemora carolleeae]|uniref:uncharacterized protein LOC111702386 n=1 Tax=Eurytemora carolleeae TaxID=1294199 RepID=UPI000C79467B|nr:uncharacterized protein LOC111702386 [Eurytemora carolleeae]|eukprot:XP_023329820.1 uncharacterized protein LOC111702386 [Eurytemora affinis]
MARHRKWNTDKKNNRELDRKVTRGWIRRDGGRSRGGEVKESPKARTRKLKEDSVQKRSSYRDILREEEREEEQNGGVRGRREEEREEEDELGRTRSSTMSLGPSGSSLYPALRHADSLPLGYRVKTTSRFMSLSSRPVPVIAHSQSLASSGTQTPRKRSVCDGQDRQTFYRYLQFKID